MSRPSAPPGAPNVWFSVSRDINGKTEPMGLIVQWPRTAAKRKALLAEIHNFEKTALPVYADPADADPPSTDDGGKYIELPLATR
jgi:hypothetical protein